MINLTRAFVICFLVAGCSNNQQSLSDKVHDQCLRIQLAQKCLESLPAGPVETKYNDWDEVVKQCDDNAMYQSVRERKYVKPECAA